MKKVALITGGTGNGIGRSVAFELSKRGYSIALNYRSNDSKAKETFELLQRYSDVVLIQEDIFLEDGCQSLVRKTLLSFGRIDVLYIGPGSDFQVDTLNDHDKEWLEDNILREVLPVMQLVPLCLADMRKRHNGTIIGMVSNTDLPSPSYSYNRAKQNRTNLLLSYVDLAWKDGITINLIAPGPVEGYSSIDEMDEPLNMGVIKPNDIARIIADLCENQNRFTTNNVFKIRF
ncbi:MAG: SDR family oxidoreductase [Bacilli bacterium]|nr:SDR family oxidoreductase [Bacilli bacterium]MBN2877087.1 SDR family oxidoreductase [Bacilli bacterium]